MTVHLTQDQFSELLAFRDGLRRFLRWSEQQARAEGLTPAQHQLLLAVKGHRPGARPTVGDIADHLLLRHHSVVELVDRAVGAGLVERFADAEDGRVVRVGLTRQGERKIAALTALHVEELKRLAPILDHLVS